MMLIKTIKIFIKKIIHKNTYSSKAYTDYLRKKGCKIGEYTHFFDPQHTSIDVDNAHFITIGNNCKITSGVIILAHDYSYSVLRPIYHTIPKKAGETIIGDNCFIGRNSIILMGTKIGNNVIIGAGSVVSGKIQDNEVWAGNPARFICTLDEYYHKCEKNFEKGARLTVQAYNERFDRDPTVQELQYFSLLFLNNTSSAVEEYKLMKFSGDNKKEVIKDCLNYKSIYNSYEDFLGKIKNDKGIQNEFK